MKETESLLPLVRDFSHDTTLSEENRQDMRDLHLRRHFKDNIKFYG